MKVFTNTSFDGFWGVGTAAVVIAENAIEAALCLNSNLRDRGLKGDVTESDMTEIDTTVEAAYILNDGNY